MNKGIWYGVGAFGLWGLLPVYWKLLTHVPAPQLLAHRALWSCATLVIVIAALRGRRGALPRLTPRILRTYSIAAVLIGANWLLYVWAVNAGFIVETSLGYFINPLISVLFGVVLLGERMRPLQWTALGIAAGGVLYLTIAIGTPPWIALALAVSFGLYGLVKKTASLGAIDGLALETSLLFPIALTYLLVVEASGSGAFLHADAVTMALVVGTGIIPTIPLLLFTAAARRIPLSHVGMLQYLAPTLQFLLGVLVYKEPFTQDLAISFALVWTALVVFGIDGLRSRSR